MKKLFLLLFAFVSGAAECPAQNNKEIKVKAEQIAYLKIYGELIKKGYDIAQAGLNLIGDIKNKDFKQHQKYFQSLATVSSSVKGSPKISEIEEMARRALTVYHRDWPKINKSDGFTENEKIYVQSVYRRLIQNCEVELTALENLLKDNKLVMKDGERLEQLDRISAQMEDNYHFICRFSAQALTLRDSRSKSRQQAVLINQL